MINFIKQKNDMKKLAYIVITSSMFLTTSCVDLTQEPQSFITEEEYIARMDLTSPLRAFLHILHKINKSSQKFSKNKRNWTYCCKIVNVFAGT